MQFTGKAAIYGLNGTIKIGAATVALETANRDGSFKSSGKGPALESSQGEAIGHAWPDQMTTASLSFVIKGNGATIASLTPSLPRPPFKVSLTDFIGEIDGRAINGFWACMGDCEIKEGNKDYLVVTLPLERKLDWDDEADVTAFVAVATMG